jgi:hypothetical protein
MKRSRGSGRSGYESKRERNKENADYLTGCFEGMET